MSIEKNKSEPLVSNDTLASLSFDYLKQLTTLSLAAAGGSVALLETVLSASRMRNAVIGAAALFFLSAICSLQAQQILVERLRYRSSEYENAGFAKLQLPRTANTESKITVISFVLFGAGIGLLVFSLINR